jgi:hypothetical protein
MKTGKRTLLFNWCAAHAHLKQLIENDMLKSEVEIGNERGWTYVTFFPQGTDVKDMLYDVDHVQRLARENGYYLPREIVMQHNKVVLTAYPEESAPVSPVLGLYYVLMSFASRFDNVKKYPTHGFYGKFGGIYERHEKGRVLAVYTRNEDALLDIYESLEKIVSETSVEGFWFDLRLSNGLSAIPRMLHGFDDPEYRRSGARHCRISDPAQFAVLLDQARQDYDRYRLVEMVVPKKIRKLSRANTQRR